MHDNTYPIRDIRSSVIEGVELFSCVSTESRILICWRGSRANCFSTIERTSWTLAVCSPCEIIILSRDSRYLAIDRLRLLKQSSGLPSLLLVLLEVLLLQDYRLHLCGVVHLVHPSSRSLSSRELFSCRLIAR